MTQKAIRKDRIFMVNSSEVDIEELAKKGARNARVRYLIDERQGSTKFSLRVYTISKNGQTPLDQHEHEHQVYVLSGQGILRSEENGPILRNLRQGDSIFIPSNAVHQFINESSEPLVFLCVKGNPKIYQPNSPNTKSTSEGASRNYC